MQQDVRQKISDNSAWLVGFNAEDNQVDTYSYDCNQLDPTFLKQNDWLENPPTAYAEQALRNLLGRISRNPNDIYSMVKRIFLLKTVNDKERLQGAVYDLFYCLGHRGQSLQKRVLQAVQDSFNQQEINFFSQGVSKEQAPTHGSMNRHSILHPGTWGGYDIVNKVTIPAAHPQAIQSPLEEAKDLLDQGNIQQATSILEKCLLDDPHDQEISDELVLIYRHMRDDKAIQRMLNKLANEDLDYRGDWLELIQKIQNEAATS